MTFYTSYISLFMNLLTSNYVARRRHDAGGNTILSCSTTARERVRRLRISNKRDYCLVSYNLLSTCYGSSLYYL